jgi:hypothetical protein
MHARFLCLLLALALVSHVAAGAEVAAPFATVTGPARPTHAVIPASGGNPTQVTLADNTNRTPSTTRATMVTVTLDWNTVPANTLRNYIVTVGTIAFSQVTIFNADAVAAARLGAAIAFLVPPNTAYKVDVDNATNLTMTAQEVQL